MTSRSDLLLSASFFARPSGLPSFDCSLFEFIRCSTCTTLGLLSRSQGHSALEFGRPNASMNSDPSLWFQVSTAREPGGKPSKLSVAPVKSQTASRRTSAERRRRYEREKFFVSAVLYLFGSELS